MSKPIGNLIANLRAYDKVSGKTTARFGPQSTMTPAAAPGAAPPALARRAVKIKKRKR
jgi:hypothetical protein